MTRSRPVSLFSSVRFRIAAWNSLAVAIVSLIALMGLREAVSWTLLHEVDQVLLEDGREVALAIKELSPAGLGGVADELRRKATGHRQHDWFVRLLAANGAVLWASSEQQADVSGAAPDAAPPLQAIGPTTIGQLRVLQRDVPPNELGVRAVRLGSSLDLLQEDMARIDRVVLGVGLLILLVSPFCGYWLAGIATRDLEAITATAARLRPEHLDERLPDRGVHDEFDRLAATINGLLDRIADYVAEKRSFLADAAHELRTPIAAIRSSVEVALGADRTKEAYRDLLEEVIEESASLEVLVNQVLLLSEAGALTDQPPHQSVSLSEVAAKSIEMFRGVAEARGVRLDHAIAAGVLVAGNKAHLRQVVNNLIDNAIKYTPSGGKATVLLSRDPHGGARLVVSDTGLGIAPEDLPRVFDRFFRADRARQRNDARGTGLGLSICQSIVEAHGGQIRCESTLGVGTSVTVVLPIGGQPVSR